MSFLLQKEEEEQERVTAKNRQVESLSVLKIEHIPCSCTIYNLTTHCYPRNQQDVMNAKLTWKVLVHRNGSKPFLTRQSLFYNSVHT